MKEFWKILKRYVSPYLGNLGGSVVLNLLSALLNIFSFSLLIPIMQILFNASSRSYEFIAWHKGMDFNEITNNVYFYVTQFISTYGASVVLLSLCVIFCLITLLKTSCRVILFNRIT